MAAWNYSNTAVETTLSNSYTAVDTSIVVASVSGFPVSFPYSLVLDHEESNREVVTVTAAAGTTLTVTRGADGTTAGSHASGAVVAHAVVARDLKEPTDHLNASTNVHGLAGGAAVVGTTSTQTLTNKTLTAPNLNSAVGTGGTYTGVTIAASTVGGTISGTMTPSSLVVDDNVFTVRDNGDTTKTMQFQLSGLTTATLRTLTVPNANTTIVGTDATQTLTSKTLTTPSITDPVITGTGTAAIASGSTTGNWSVGGNLSVTGIGQRLFVKKSADETINNVGALQDDDDLQLAVVVNAVYLFELKAVYNSGTTPDFLIGWSFPTSATCSANLLSVINGGAGAYTLIPHIQTDLPNLEGSGADRSMHLWGTWTTGGTSGTVKFRWAQLTATVANTVVKAGSYFTMTRIS